MKASAVCRSCFRRVLAVGMMALSLVPFAASADTETVGSVTWTYSVSNGEAIITKSSATTGDLVIPSTLGGYPVTSIGKFAFWCCSGLKSVTIPSSVTSIGESAFSGCSGLKSVTIPSSVTSIGWSAFSGCSGLKSVTIPSSVTSIDSSAFSRCSGLTSFSVATDNPKYQAINGLLCTKDGKTVLFGVNGDVVIPEGVESIGNDAFSGCSGLKSVTIPSGVESISSRAFSGCSGLTSVTIPSSVTSIGSSAFSGCSGLTSVTIPSSVESIGSSAFYDCSGLTSVTIPSSVESIGTCAFQGCSRLTSVTIPSSVTLIGNDVFYGCSGLTSVTILANVKSISSSAFYGCSGLKSVTIPEGVESIGNNAFSGCRGLKSVTIPSGVKSIGDDAFWGCSGLTSVTIPSSATSIGKKAFADCSGLKSVKITDLAAWCQINFGSDDANPLYYAHKLYLNDVEITDLTIPSSVTNIGYSAFSGCSGLKSVTIPSSVTSIGYRAFSGCSGLKSVTIPSSVTNIGSSAFYGCSGLESVYVGKGDTERVRKLYSWPSGVKFVEGELPEEETWFVAGFGANGKSLHGGWADTVAGVSVAPTWDGARLALEGGPDPVVFAADEAKSSVGAVIVVRTSVGFVGCDKLPGIASDSKAGFCAMDGGHYFVLGYDSAGRTNRWVDSGISASFGGVVDVVVTVSDGVAEYAFGGSSCKTPVNAAAFNEVVYSGVGRVAALDADCTAGGSPVYPEYIPADDADAKAKFDVWAANYGRDARGENRNAFLLGCDPAKVGAAEEAFRITSVGYDAASGKWTCKVVGGKGEGDGYGNGYIHIVSVKSKFPSADGEADFFQATLTVSPVP